MLTLYGIPNCDSCRKARRWLEQRDIDYRFHDVREDGLTSKEIDRWATHTDWRKLVNTRSTTWRNLNPAEKSGLTLDSATALLAANPTLLKRPVAEKGDTVLVGFSDRDYADL